MNRATRCRTGGLLAICAFLAGGIALAADTPRQPGTFALVGGTPHISADISEKDTSAGVAVIERQFLNGQHILSYTMDLQHPMHMVLVRDDLTTFEHVHPGQDVTTGSFHETFTGLDANHRYYLYADSKPSETPQQVFRFSLQANNIAAVPPASTLAASATTVKLGRYDVHLSTTTLTSNVENKLTFNVDEKGRPAHDLSAYLGVAAHAVLIDAQTLGYLHVHATVKGVSMEDAMKAADNGEPLSGPIMDIHLPALAPGSYKLWIQFEGYGLKVYTAPYTLAVQ